MTTYINNKQCVKCQNKLNQQIQDNLELSTLHFTAEYCKTLQKLRGVVFSFKTCDVQQCSVSPARLRVL